LQGQASYRILNPTKTFNTFMVSADLYSEFDNRTGRLQAGNINLELDTNSKKMITTAQESPSVRMKSMIFTNHELLRNRALSPHQNSPNCVCTIRPTTTANLCSTSTPLTQLSMKKTV
jgi:hypothetical protein